jgi:hypothetical protein
MVDALRLSTLPLLSQQRAIGACPTLDPGLKAIFISLNELTIFFANRPR